MIVLLQNTGYTISLLQTPATEVYHDLLKFSTEQHAPQEPIIESFDRERFFDAALHESVRRYWSQEDGIMQAKNTCCLSTPYANPAAITDPMKRVRPIATPFPKTQCESRAVSRICPAASTIINTAGRLSETAQPRHAWSARSW
jgi:hypothetical protein